MTLLPNERVIPLAAPAITLTTHRIRLLASGSGYFTATSIMLEELVSCAATKTESPILLYLAVIVAALGILFSIFATGAGPGPAILGIFFGVILLVLYLATRRTALAFASGGGARIVISTGHMEPAVIVDVIDTIEEAKDQRARSLEASRTGQTTSSRSSGTANPLRGQSAPAHSSPARTRAAAGRGLTYYFYVGLDGTVAGPVTAGELRRMLDDGIIAWDAQVCAEGVEQWQPLEAVVAR